MSWVRGPAMTVLAPQGPMRLELGYCNERIVFGHEEKHMDCPACGKTLQEVTVGNVTVDVCKGGCGGIWFDRFELGKIDEADEAGGEELLGVERSPDVTVDLEARRNCPKCDNVVMMQHLHNIGSKVIVDECPTCGGYWLDAGELSAIRTGPDEEERRELMDTHITELFGQSLTKMREESEDKRAKAKKVAGFFRWILPSNYMKGKQDWGAF